jgi:hypothetical protein
MRNTWVLKHQFPVGTTVEVVGERLSLFGYVGVVVDHHRSGYIEVRFATSDIDELFAGDECMRPPNDDFIFTTNQLKVLVKW